ncbi:hypothetical protein [Nocardia aurea]|uniref:hypothetical protein n=1 Tax=Nocardia aurea TaxID=2144174 RepID=UPI000D697E02|nr:hypothetical protein [Nocardia aurea]
MITINVENSTKIVVTVHDSGGGASEICIEENTADIEIVVDAARSMTALVTVNDSATEVHTARA